MPHSPPPERIVITGIAGAIGQTIAPALAGRGHAVRGFDRQPCSLTPDHVVGDLNDPTAVDRAVADRDVIIHLAAYPNPGDFLGDLLQPNVVGLHQLMEAATRHGVRRLILASTMQVLSGLWKDRPDDAGPVGVDEEGPNNLYALTKVWAEQYGRMLTRTTPIQVVSARIGWFPRVPEEARHLAGRPSVQSHYLSTADTARFFIAATEADASTWPDRYQAFYVVGPQGSAARPVDLDPGRRLLGFEPRDPFPVNLPFPWPPHTPKAATADAPP